VAARRRTFACTVALVSLAGFAVPAAGQTRADCERAYTPQRAQEGKDVVWAPTEDSMVLPMLELAKVTAVDKLYDLGSGDGKIPIAAAKHFGATAVGIEYEPELVEHARCLARADRVEARVTFVQADLFEADFSDATVVTLYLLPELNLRLRPTLLAMKPGTRVVSYSFTMDDWEPDDSVDSFGDGSAYLWIVPANAAGTWTFRPASAGERFEVELEQHFQKIRGFAGTSFVAGSLSGDEISFAFMQGAEHVQVAGTVAADRIAATVTRAGASRDYVATRD
jgi:SAM-dependent methyltransferase